LQQEFLTKLGVQKQEFLDSTTTLSIISKTTGLCPIFTRIPAVPVGEQARLYPKIDNL
jgi:hypothetical protein